MTGCHAHDHQHHHPKPTFNKAFLIAISANSIFVVFQIMFAYVASSTSLFADAIHNLGDVFSLIVAWVGNYLLKHKPTVRSTFGMKKASILAALANVLLLVFSCGIIATEAIYKLISPSSVEAGFVMVIAGIGILVNAGTAILFLRGQDDLNIRAAFLHLAFDALISVGVVVTAALLYWTGWMWLDPLVGLIIAIMILKSSWGLLVDSTRLILDGVPKQVSMVEIKELLLNQTGVNDIHDLHVWALSTQENALSVHLWMPDQDFSDQDRHELTQRLRQLHIHHVTIQIEKTQTHCADTCLSYI